MQPLWLQKILPTQTFEQNIVFEIPFLNIFQSEIFNNFIYTYIFSNIWHNAYIKLAIFFGMLLCDDVKVHNNSILSNHLHQAEALSFIPSFCSDIQSDSFLCDCQLDWFPEWLVTRGLQPGVQATCAHPENLKGTSIYQAPPQSFVCRKQCYILHP